jgi:glycosyltransferase involved in cell wall biosynthesis
MRIAIDCRDMLGAHAGAYAGVSHYVDGITRALLRNGSAHAFSLFFRADVPRALIEQLAANANVDIHLLPMRRGSFYVSHIRTASLMRAVRADILFAPAGQLPFGWRGKSVLTAHDLAIYSYPEWFPEQTIGQIFSTRVIVPASFRKASGIIAVSQATKQEVIQTFRLPEECIRVIPEAVSVPSTIAPLSADDGQRFGIRGRYLLTLGTIEPRKNFVLLIEAFLRWREQHPHEAGAVQLVIAGRRGWRTEAFSDALELAQRRHGNAIVELGYVTDAQKWSLLKGAEAFVYPSLYEGFGLPVLEAMTIGTPVITTRQGAIPEVGGDAVRYVSAEDPEEFALALHDLAAHPEARSTLAELGHERARAFSWDAAAKQTLAYFESL